MDWLLYAGVRTVDIHLYLCVLFCLYLSLWLCKHKLPTPHIMYSYFFVLTLKTTIAALCLSEYNECFLCLKCWPLSCFWKTYCIMDCNLLQSCMALAFVNIKTPVYTDVCELSVKRLHCLISLLMYSVHQSARPYRMMPTHLMSHTMRRIYLSHLRQQKGNEAKSVSSCFYKYDKGISWSKDYLSVQRQLVKR